MNLWRKMMAWVSLLSFVCLAVFGLLITAERLESHGHHGGAQQSTCPFMPSEQSDCLMSFTDHVSAWQHFLQIIIAAKVITALLIVWFIARFIRTHWALGIQVFTPSEYALPPPLSRVFFTTTIQPRAP